MRRKIELNIIIKKKKKKRSPIRRKKRGGGRLLENIAKWGVNMGAKTFFKTGLNAESKALYSEIGKKID